MSYNKSIVPGILVKAKAGLGYFNNKIDHYNHPEDRFYILIEIETNDVRGRDMLIFYGLIEERFFRKYRWYIDGSVNNRIIDIVV